MAKYQDIFSPEALKKLNQSSAETAQIMLGNSSIMNIMRSSQMLLSNVISIEKPYKSQLEQLAINIVKDHYPNIEMQDINIDDAKIVSMSDVASSLDEESTSQEKKRRIANALAQGASVQQLYDLFKNENVIQQINAIDSSLYEKYDQLMNEVFGIYHNNDAIAMLLAAVASGAKPAGGSSKIIISEALGVRARAVCFPMLVHEILKGYWSIIAQSGLKGSEEERKATINKVDKLENEPEDLRYGPIIFKKLETIYKAFAPVEIDPRTFVLFYMSVLKLDPEDKFFSFVDNVVSGRPLTDEQTNWVEAKIEKAQDYLQRKDTEDQQFKDQLRQLGLEENKKPYTDIKTTDKYIIREFNANIDPIELMWHRDNEARTIEIIGKTDWKIQLDNQLPTSLNEQIHIPKHMWHRIIKGNGNLRLKIHKKQ